MKNKEEPSHDLMTQPEMFALLIFVQELHFDNTMWNLLIKWSNLHAHITHKHKQIVTICILTNLSNCLCTIKTRQQYQGNYTLFWKGAPKKSSALNFDWLLISSCIQWKQQVQVLSAASNKMVYHKVFSAILIIFCHIYANFGTPNSDLEIR